MTDQQLRKFGVRIAAMQRSSGVPIETILRDHALTYMLAGIAGTPDLVAQVVFKGGTALRKAYFPRYRFSQDLDFSTRDQHVWTPAEIAELLTQASKEATRLASAIEEPYRFIAAPQQHREDRTDMQHDFRITVEFPTGATLPIKFELTQVEPIVTPVFERELLHAFEGENIAAALPVYSLDEIAIEKLRAFLQTAANLERRDWTNRARDLYDLWWLRNEEEAAVTWSGLLPGLETKANARDVTFSGPESFLDTRVINSYRADWQSRLADVVPELPEFDIALQALTEILADVFSTS